MADAVTMDKIVSLCRRRGFVFPSSEIYGGLGSSYDYGHYGVLLKENVKARWLEAMVQEREDIVALDSSIILHPRVWEASGHIAGFTDPLVDCRTCKLRFRADHMDDSSSAASGRASSPGETPDCDLTEARQFNLMFETRVGAVEETGLDGLPAAGDRAGHLRQLQERRPARAPQAAVRHRPDRQVVPQRDHARQLHLPHARVRADGDGVLRPARRGGRVVPLLDRRASRTGICGYGIRGSHLRVRPHDADELSHYSSGTSDIEYLYPIGWSELEGIANRGDYDLTAHAEPSGTKLEWVDAQSGERYVPYVIEPAARRQPVNARVSLSTPTTRRSSRSANAPCSGSIPQIAPVKAAVLPLIAKDAGHGRRRRARCTRSCGRSHCRVRRRWRRSAAATGGRTRSARRSRSRSTSSRSRTTRSRSATATRSRRSGSRSRAPARTCSTG